MTPAYATACAGDNCHLSIEQPHTILLLSKNFADSLRLFDREL
jgi:hypothetical protein